MHANRENDISYSFKVKQSSGKESSEILLEEFPLMVCQWYQLTDILIREGFTAGFPLNIGEVRAGKLSLFLKDNKNQLNIKL